MKTIASDTITLTSVKDVNEKAVKANTLAEAAAEHFWSDEEGSHITEKSQVEFVTEPEGGNTLVTPDGLIIRKGEKDVASFKSSGATMGATDSSHIVLDNDSIDFKDGGNTQFSIQTFVRQYENDSGDLTSTRFVSPYGSLKFDKEDVIKSVPADNYAIDWCQLTVGQEREKESGYEYQNHQGVFTLDVNGQQYNTNIVTYSPDFNMLDVPEEAVNISTAFSYRDYDDPSTFHANSLASIWTNGDITFGHDEDEVFRDTVEAGLGNVAPTGLVSLKKSLQAIADKFSGKSRTADMFTTERRYSAQQDLAADGYLTNTIDITKSGYIPIAVQGITAENNGGQEHTRTLLRGFSIVDNELRIHVRNVHNTKAANFRHYADILYVKG